MPVTIAHVAAVLPARSRRLAEPLRRLPTAPLVIGSMVPDLPAILGMAWLRSSTHTLLAAVSVDVLLTAGVALVWWSGVRPVVLHVVPGLAARWVQPAAGAGGRGRWVWWYAAAAMGSLTHVLWDAVTHTTEGAALGLLELAGHDRLLLALQVLSSVLGIAALIAWGVLWWRRTPTRTLPGGGAPPTVRRVEASAVGLLVLVCSVSWGAWRGLRLDELRDGDLRRSIAVGESLFGLLAGAALAAVLLACASWAWRLSRVLADRPVRSGS